MTTLMEQPSWRETIPAIASPDGYIASESENVRDAQILGLTDRTRYLYQALNNIISGGSSDSETEDDMPGFEIVGSSNIKITKLDDCKYQISAVGIVKTINGNTGDVEIVPASIGAAAYDHNHDDKYALKTEVSDPLRFIAGPGIILDKESTPGAIIISTKTGITNDAQQNQYNGVPNINYNIGYPPHHDYHEHHHDKPHQPKIKIKAGTGIDIKYDEETNTYTVINTELNTCNITEEDYINLVNNIETLQNRIDELEDMLTKRPGKPQKPQPPMPPMPPHHDEHHPNIPPMPPLPPHHEEPKERWKLEFTLGAEAQIALGDIADYSAYLTPISNTDFWGRDINKTGKYDSEPRVIIYRDSGTASNPSGKWIRVPRTDADDEYIEPDPVFGTVSFDENSRLITFTKGGSTNYLFKIVCKY